MIDADVTLEVSATCDQCKKSVNNFENPDPWMTYNLEDEIEEMLQRFIGEGWEIEDEAALCPECVDARDNDEPAPEPYADNGGIHPMDGVGLKLFDA
jgi:hypothetical protein